MPAAPQGERLLGRNFDESLTAGFRWPLDPRDDLPGIVAAIEALFAECRVTGIGAVPRVLPDLTAQGVPCSPAPWQRGKRGIRDWGFGISCYLIPNTY